MDQYYVDEGLWIYSGKLYTDLLFRHHDVDHPVWEHHLRTWGNFNPQVGKYIIGLSLNTFAEIDTIPNHKRSVGGSYPINPRYRMALSEILIGSVGKILGYSHEYDFSEDLDWNSARGRVPPRELLRPARLGVVVCSLAAGFSLFMTSLHLGGWTAAWVTTILFFLNPVIVRYSRVAVVDIPLLCFVLAGIYGLLLITAFPPARSWMWWLVCVLTGLAWGLAISTKLSAVAPWLGGIVATGMLVAVALLRKRHGAIERPMGRQVVFLGVLVITPVILFVLTNPFLYEAPLMPFGGQKSKIHQIFFLGSYVTTYDKPDRLATLPERLASVVGFFSRRATVSSYLKWPLSLEMVMFVVGALTLLWTSIRGKMRSNVRKAWVIFVCVSGFTWAATISWLPFSWARLYVPLIPFYVVVAGLGLSSLLLLLVTAARTHNVRADESSPS